MTSRAACGVRRHRRAGGGRAQAMPAPAAAPGREGRVSALCSCDQHGGSCIQAPELVTTLIARRSARLVASAHHTLPPAGAESLDRSAQLGEEGKVDESLEAANMAESLKRQHDVSLRPPPARPFGCQHTRLRAVGCFRQPTVGLRAAGCVRLTVGCLKQPAARSLVCRASSACAGVVVCARWWCVCGGGGGASKME